MFNYLKPASISVNIYGSCIYSQKRYNTTVCYNVWYVLRIMYVTYSMLCSMLYYAQKHWYSQTDDGKTCVNHFSIDSVWNWIFCHSISFSLYLNLSIPHSEASAHSYKLAKDIGRSPGLVVMGGDSCSKGCGFESQHCIQDELFCLFEKTKN